jgi:transglutaminase-like putative cysteine protease
VRRRLLAAVLPVAAVAFAWASLERAPEQVVFVAVAGVTLLAAVPRTLRSRTAVAGAVLIGLTLLYAGSTATAMRDVADRGLRDFYAVPLPFDPLAHPEMHALVALATVMFGLTIAVTAGSRPLVAAAMAAGGVAWPATILPAQNTLAMGGLALLAALWPVVVTGARDRRGFVPGIAVLACVVVVATAAAGAGARPSTAALGWESWDLFGNSRAGQAVALIWSSNYGGIDFPAKETTVLRIVAPRRALYWRATTLDSFAGDRWLETLYATARPGAARTLPRDELLPSSASSRRGWVKQEVEVRALVDDHVIAAGQPMEIAADSDRRIFYLSGGVMRAPDGLGQMRHYTVWSYAPRPTPAALVRSPPAYPPALERYLDVGRTIVPPFGAPGRTAAVSALFSNDLYQQLWPYEATWREGRRLTARARSPYEATVAIERWLRSDGGFTYDEHPPAPAGLPPLVDFLERTKRGYCQQFAGTMALMLRYLGIPSRVAVGFTSGTWKDGAWTVTDHDAHAWVEVWFAGQGWLPFDPTPGRGRLSATYTNASDSADAIRALGTGRFLDLGSRATTVPARGVARKEQPGGRSIHWSLIVPFAALVVALVVALAGLALTKSLQRYRRAATSDPRHRASAARGELAAFIRDQGSPVAGTASITELVVELRRLGVGSDAFAAAFARARYGPPSGASGAADDTRRELRRVLSMLRTRLGPGRRIRGFLTVRSLRARARRDPQGASRSGESAVSPRA